MSKGGGVKTNEGGKKEEHEVPMATDLITDGSHVGWLPPDSAVVSPAPLHCDHRSGL